MYNVTHKDYTFVESDNVDFYGIKLNGEFDGVVLIYGKVGIREDKTLDIATLSFTYTIKDPADNDHDELCADEYFNNYIGAVLEHIINDTQAEKLDEDIIGHNKPNRNTHA